MRTGNPSDGVRFDSRHGDGLALWAVFEQPGDPAVTPRLTDIAGNPLNAAAAELQEVFGIHHLAWVD